MKRRALVAALLIGAAVMSAGPAGGTPTSTSSRLDPRLRVLAESRRVQSGHPDGIPEAQTVPMADGDAVVMVIAEGGSAGAARAVEAVGGRLLGVDGRSIAATVPIESLAGLAESAGVRYVVPAPVPIAEGTVSEGVALHEAPGWWSAGVDGSGVQVLIVDIGFRRLGDSVTSGDLPTHVLTQQKVGPSCDTGTLVDDPLGSEHGTAVTEIVHDMAPGAELFVYLSCGSADGSDIVAYAATHGIDVVNQSLGYFNTGPLDGSDPYGFLSFIDDVVAGGAVWVNSAGNYQRGHWLGTWTSGVGGRLDFGGADDAISVSLLAGDPVYLRWDDFPGSDIDLDLFLVYLGTDVATSTTGQTGAAPPTEQILAPFDGDFTIEVRLGSGESAASIPAGMKIDLLVPNGDIELSHRVTASSLNDPAALASVLAAGAAWWANDAHEPFSSEGPTWDSRIKPDLTGYDGVTTNAFGYQNFFGTSAAAPHTAGAAALIIGGFPCLTPAQTALTLEALTNDRGPAGPDNAYGAGIIALGSPNAVTGMSCEMRRFYGKNRYETAANLSANTYPSGATTVFIATGSNFPDALAGAAVAAKLGAPILLVNTNSIPAGTATELARLTPDDIVILGGTAAISSTVQTQLAPYSTNPPTRLAGANRYDTARLISQYGFPGGATTVFIATGTNYPDALAGGAGAAALNAPILLVSRDSIPPATAAELARLSPDDIVILGGTAAISSAVGAQLAPYSTNPPTRLAGANRYDTARLISQYGFPGGATTVFIATGTNYPDALAGGAAAGRGGAPLLIVDSASVPGSVSAEITRLHPTRITILGGPSAVSATVQVALQSYLG